MNRVIVLNGFSQVGKDTFMNLVEEILGSENVYKISMVDCVREWATVHLNYQGERNTEARQMLYHCKKMLEEWCDYPYQMAFSRILKHKDRKIIFVCAREHDDIDRLVAAFEAKTVLIHKHYIAWKIPDNSADRNVLNREYDYTIYNDGSIADLKEAAMEFLKELNIIAPEEGQ